MFLFLACIWPGSRNEAEWFSASQLGAPEFKAALAHWPQVGVAAQTGTPGTHQQDCLMQNSQNSKVSATRVIPLPHSKGVPQEECNVKHLQHPQSPRQFVFCHHRIGSLMPQFDVWLIHLWHAKVFLHVWYLCRENVQFWMKLIRTRIGLRHHGQVERDRKWALYCTHWASLFSCISVI